MKYLIIFYNLEICNTVCDALPKETKFGTKPVKIVIEKK